MKKLNEFRTDPHIQNDSIVYFICVCVCEREFYWFVYALYGTRLLSVDRESERIVWKRSK